MKHPRTHLVMTSSSHAPSEGVTGSRFHLVGTFGNGATAIASGPVAEGFVL